MNEALFVTLLPAGFLTLLFRGGALFRRQNVDQDGEPPIDKGIFLTSKYCILLVWAITVLHSWGISPSFLRVPALFKWPALVLWGLGFALLFAGRLGLGSSFRLGSPREQTRLTVGGLFRISRNPMYLGVYSTLLASVLYTLSPLVLIVGAFVAVVHHRIVLAEERYLRSVFGPEYAMYCSRVGRYL